MTEFSTDQPETAIAAQGGGILPVLITFALLFLLSAAVWFVLDRIRADEVRTATTSQTGTARHASGTGVETNKVAVK
jgi:hypothetical protein